VISKLYYGPLAHCGAACTRGRPDGSPSHPEAGNHYGARGEAGWGQVGATLRSRMSSDSVSTATRRKMARSVLTKNLGVKKGEQVVVEAWSHTLPWAVAFAHEAREIGAQVMVPFEDEESYWELVDGGETAVIGKVPKHEFAALAKTDVYIHMWGPHDRIRVSQLPPKKFEQLIAWNEPWYKVADQAGVRGARLDIGRPTPGLSKLYAVDESEWTDQLVRASMVSPESIAKTAAPLVKALSKGKQVHITDDHGTDLTLGLARRPVRCSIGRKTPEDAKWPYSSLVNVPAGLLRVALDEHVADGTLVANRTNYADDAFATGGVLEFRKGRLTSAKFATGQSLWDDGYKTGGKGRDQPGLLGIGLNPALHNTPQLEDAELGAILVSTGGNAQLKGKNKSPFFGFAISAGATLVVDGKEIPIR
jgi:leucyl aminopeptidase (aminopeptidase T)